MERQANFLLLSEVKNLTPSDVLSFNSDDSYDAFKVLRWGWADGTPHCLCGSISLYEYNSRKIFKCKVCGIQFSVSSRTTFHARKLSYRDILHGLSLTIHEPSNVHQLSLEMDINYRTAHRLAKNFRMFAGNIRPDPRDNRWPFLRRAPQTEFEHMMMRVAQEIPHEWPEQVRGDVGQELIAGLIAADFAEEQLKSQIKKYIRLHYRSVEFNKFRDVSLNAPVPGTDGMPWDDILNADRT